MFDGSTLLKYFLQGGFTLAVTIGIYYIMRKYKSIETAGALAFLTLVICNLGMILSNWSLTRSSVAMLKEKNAAFKWVMTGTIVVMWLIDNLIF